MADDNEWVKLPAEEKCQHKLWKARVAGYEELIKLFRSLDEKSPEFSKYAGLLKKFVTDNNAISQEKAMDAVKAFVENASVASKTCGEVVSGIVAKCFNARPKTKETGMEIIMLYIEIEKQDVVQESLLEGLENKQPKIVIGCIQALKDSLSCFGNKIMPIKPVLKFIPKLLEDRDKTVRDETKQLVIEIYRWIGAALKPQMTNFKPIQVQELEAEFEKMPNKKPQQTRFLRSQQDLKAKMEEQAAGDGVDAGEGNDEGGAEEIDPFELMEAVNILPLIPKDFYEKVEAKKWQERKEALEALQKLTENLRIEPGDFQPVIKVLLKVIGKDTNVMLVALGGKILAGLANGLRKEFKQYAQQCFSVLLEKFKEKKAMVVTALRESLDAVYVSANLEMITEDCLASLDNKNPNIKTEAALFLSRCFARCTTATLPKKILKTFCAALTKGCNDTAPEVREACFEALGVAMKVVTEKNIAPFLTDVEQIKMQRIQECCQKAVLFNAKGEPRSGSGGGAPAPSAPKAGSTEPKPVQRPGTAAATSAPPKAGPAGDRPKTAPPKSGGPPKKTGGPPKGKGKGSKKGAAASKGAEECSELAISDEAAEEKAATLLQADVMNQLASANWKERLAAMENFTEVVKKMDRDQIPCQVFVRIICKKPGLKETNFQVLKLKIDLVAHLASNSQFTVRSAEVCLCDLVDKVGDVKNGSAVQEALSCISEAVSLDYVSLQVLTMAFDQKNPKNQSEALVWLSKAIKEFGLKVNVKAMIQTIKKAFEATNVAVRNAAITLIATIYMYMGQQLRMFFEDEKPALLQQIDAEIEKVKDEKPPVPTRAYRPAGAADDEDEEEEAEKGEGEAEEENVNDLVPRTDVGDQFTEELMTMMADKNWKVRGEALQKVISILNSAKFVTANLGPLPEALKTRLNDNNKILVTTAIGICVTLATSLGPHCKVHVKIIAPALIGCLTDTKPTLRSVTIGALNAWIDHTTLLPLVEAEILSESLKNENPFLRQELLGWLAERLPNHKPLPAELKMCIPHLLNCLEDRNADVRKKAQDALVPFMIHVGYESVFKATNKLKPASKESVLQIIEKAKANLPAKPPPKAKKAVEAAVPAPAPPAHTKKAASAPPTIEDDEETEKPPTKSSSSENLDKEKKKPGPGKSKPKSAPAPSSKRKKEEEDTSPPMTLTISKEQRFKDEKNMKVLKWNFVEPRAEFVEQLKLQMEKNFNKTLMDQLFHTDFKFHIKAIEKLMQCIPSHQDETVGNLDMILKWFTLRFFDTNPSMLNKALEYLQGMFTMLSEVDYHLTDLEANSFVPYLIIKVGENKDNVRREVRNIFKLIYNVYPASKMFVFISDGLKCKNAKQRQECLEELGFMIEQYGISICQPNPSQALKLIAGQIGDRDNGVRNASLNSMVSAFTILGEGIFKHIGSLSDKDQSLLDERIKRSAKNKPPPAKEEKPKTAPQQPQRSASQASIQRQSTGIPKSASSNSVKKEFQLEIDKEPSNGSKIEIPKLNQYNLEEIFQPVEYPKIKARPPSPSTKFFNSTDAANSINFVISQITNRDITTSLQALSQIDEVLKDKEKAAEIMASHVEQLLIALSMQFKMVYSTHMGDEQASSEDVVRLYRCLLGTLLALFQNTNLAVRASRDILKDLINNLVTILLDNRLVELEEGPQVIRTVNVMVVKIVEKSDHTNILSALVRLLQECVGSETCTSKFLELIMKCIWRMVRMFPDIVNDLNLDRILYDTHLFLKAFPAISWKDRPNDQPLRTIKTILHSLTVLKGPKILTHLEQVDGPSDVKIYVQKVLKSENKLHSTEEINGGDEAKTPKSASKSKRLSKTTHDMLAEIFKKIGSKENTLEGLNDLYDFKKKYPDADIEPFLKKSSQFFQNYIERGLSNIEKEREGQKGKGSSSSVDGPVMISTTTMTTTVTSRPAPLGDVKGDADYYMERLRILRARCGLDNSEPPASENQSQPVTKSELLTFQKPEEEERNDENKEEPTSQAAPTSTVDVSELKARLERIKKLAKS